MKDLRLLSVEILSGVQASNERHSLWVQSSSVQKLTTGCRISAARKCTYFGALVLSTRETRRIA
jgi:hypothetical protein